MPDRVEIEGDNLAVGFIDAIKQGIRNSMSTPMTEAEIEKRRKEEVKERQARAKEFLEQQNKPSKAELVNIIKEKFANATAEAKKGMTDYMKEIEIQTLKEPEIFEVEQLEKIIEILG